MDKHRLDQVQLRGYARSASKIRSEFSSKAGQHGVNAAASNVNADSESNAAFPLSQDYRNTYLSMSYDNTLYPANPASPNRKRRTLRQLNVSERVKIVKMLASKKRTGQEVADVFNVKLQVVRDLNKDLKGK